MYTKRDFQWPSYIHDLDCFFSVPEGQPVLWLVLKPGGECWQWWDWCQLQTFLPIWDLTWHVWTLRYKRRTDRNNTFCSPLRYSSKHKGIWIFWHGQSMPGCNTVYTCYFHVSASKLQVCVIEFFRQYKFWLPTWHTQTIYYPHMLTYIDVTLE